jgi:ELWxxDGT repeat protein
MRVPKIILILGLLATNPPTHAAGARLLADLNPGAVGSYPSNYTAYGPLTLFTAYTLETGFELWKTDGNSVTLAANINPTADDIGFGVLEGNDSLPDWLTVFDGQLFFSAFEPQRGAELWRYDGTQAFRVSDINADANDTIKVLPGNAWPRELTVLNNVLYFGATTSTNPPNYELWSFDGTTVRQAANIHPDLGRSQLLPYRIDRFRRVSLLHG